MNNMTGSQNNVALLFAEARNITQCSIAITNNGFKLCLERHDLICSTTWTQRGSIFISEESNFVLECFNSLTERQIHTVLHLFVEYQEKFLSFTQAHKQNPQYGLSAILVNRDRVQITMRTDTSTLTATYQVTSEKTLAISPEFSALMDLDREGIIHGRYAANLLLGTLEILGIQ